MKKKIAFIVQRYGLEVNGGAEYHCRILAEHLADDYDVEVLTSCAKNYLTWADEYPEGETIVNGIPVKRFPSNTIRDWKRFRSLTRKLKKRKPYQKVLRFLGLLPFYERILPEKVTEEDNEKWVKWQGPYIPGLVHYLENNHSGYDALIFFTYLYYPTIFGIRVAPEKSILVPTAHDEPPIYFPLFRKFFEMPKAIIYNTASEKNFVNRLFGNEAIYSDIAGVGIEAHEPAQHLSPWELIGSNSDYLIYIGRVDGGKGCQIMFNHFLRYKKEYAGNIKLVLVGQAFMKIPSHPDIVTMGFAEEDVKINLLKGALASVMPSFYESLSMVTLESMAYGIPVIVNGHCEVLNDHINASKAGYSYYNYTEFASAVNKLNDSNQTRTVLAERARLYVKNNYTWPVVKEKFNNAINYITESN
ncbi:glycosyltransferase [Mucilaginibacter terrenus]|uniref:Glycosyltransferase n=1 Tax=Mucilaginibacter terrenus TaxID=2482727 RepID=A0A3E2NQB2_9SPHI|nr:glycosyltransferase family 4 protein [Mucilaginibacter terrenus]RFZ83187.1 glycosyltransferase [Mucilaginibacter terrenus]